MEKTELVKKYELVIIVDAKVANEEKEAILKDCTDAIEKYNGKIINSQVWLEKQKFTFDIKKRNEGTYYLVNFEMVGSGMGKIRAALRLKEKVLRYLITKLEK